MTDCAVILPTRREYAQASTGCHTWVKYTIIRIKLVCQMDCADFHRQRVTSDAWEETKNASCGFLPPLRRTGFVRTKLCLGFFLSNPSSERWWSLGLDSLAFFIHLRVTVEPSIWDRFLNNLIDSKTSENQFSDFGVDWVDSICIPSWSGQLLRFWLALKAVLISFW